MPQALVKMSIRRGERDMRMINHPNAWTATQQAAGQSAAAAWQKYFQTQRPPSTAQSDALADSAGIAEAQSKHELALLAMDNVVGVAPSIKMTGGSTDRPALLDGAGREEGRKGAAG
jgi:hypothetical protein